MISCCGIGYINRLTGWRRILSGTSDTLEDRASFNALARSGIFSHPFKNFARLDTDSKMVCYAMALALQDAGETYGDDSKSDIGVIGTNTDGSLRSDIAYFRDYLEGGRRLSRGNLFLYTLPSSPLGEAAIHFGLQGPLYYMTSACALGHHLIEAVSDMLREMPAVLAAVNNDLEAVCFLFKGDAGHKRAVVVEESEALSVFGEMTDLLGLAEAFVLLQKTEGPLHEN